MRVFSQSSNCGLPVSLVEQLCYTFPSIVYYDKKNCRNKLANLNSLPSIKQIFKSKKKVPCKICFNPFSAAVQNTCPSRKCRSSLGVATWLCAACKVSIFLVCHGDPVENKYMYIHILTPFYVYYMNVVEKLKILSFRRRPTWHQTVGIFRRRPTRHSMIVN